MQGGISTPSKHDFIILFTSAMGEQYGYKDGWNEQGLYTGEGQQGDMAFIRGNLAIRDHVENGKALHLLKKEVIDGTRQEAHHHSTRICKEVRLSELGESSAEDRHKHAKYKRWVEIDPEQAKVWRYAWDLLLTDRYSCNEANQLRCWFASDKRSDLNRTQLEPVFSRNTLEFTQSISFPQQDKLRRLSLQN
jgi:hypothetical protein